MKFSHNLFFALALLCAARPALAQQELLLHQSDRLWHRNSLNPAFFPDDKRIAIGLPGFSLDAAHSGDVTYNDLFRREGDRTVIDFGPAIDKLEPENRVFFDQRTATASVGFKLPGGLIVMAGHAFRLHGVITYPQELPEVIWGGNAQFIGETINIAPAADIMDWNEWSAGVAKSFGIVSVGVRAKYLAGISSIDTDDDHRQATVFTDPDIYQLRIQSDYSFRSSGLISVIDTSGLGFRVGLTDFDRKIFTQNSGFAFDLGIEAKVTDKLRLSASVLDLGGTIRWKEEAYRFRSNGTFEYNGIDFPGSDLLTGGDSISFSNKLDTLNDIFQFVRTSEEFSTKIPVRFYVGGSFQLNSAWRFGAAVFHQQATDRSATAVGANVHWSILRWLTIGALYNGNGRSAANLGFALELTPGPVQIYLLSDNAFSAFSLKSKAAVNLRFGASVVL
jgi:hypothetical protein